MAGKGALLQRRGIFIKMFAWFWLVMAVVISIIFAIDKLTDTQGRETPVHHAVEAPLSHYGRIAVDRFERGDRQGLAGAFKDLKSVAGMSGYLFGPDGREIDGNTAPAEVAELASRAGKSGMPEHSFTHPRILAAIHLEGRSGVHYVAVGKTPNREAVSSWGIAFFWLTRLGTALVISLFACYLLARYMTVPIIRLRDATRQLASGDLTLRMSPAAGKRRDELGELARDFDLMAGKLQLLLSSQRQLLGNVSHELRSPLARLNVALELARRHSTPEAEKSLNRIEWEAERLNELIGEVLTLTRLEGAMGNVKREQVDLAGLIREIADDADFEAQSLNKAVRFVEGEKCVVTGVRQLLRSAIENVVRNAVGYTGEGTEAEIRLRSEENKGSSSAVVTVRDHGPGVPEEALTHLFRPFYRVDESRERHTGGTGLGLAITERAVLIHGGAVRAHNAPDGGLVIEITIPYLTSL
jgi:two-component system, OmpR family, sensor histidine kinase CpxA